MSASDKDFERMIEKLDSGQNENIPDELKKEYQAIVAGAQCMEEVAFREQLNEAHKSMEREGRSNSKYYWMAGIAASIVGVLFWWNSFTSEPTQFELKMDEAPAYADSASYDSLKKVEMEVDKSEE